jgi:hypothetical protein
MNGKVRPRQSHSEVSSNANERRVDQTSVRTGLKCIEGNDDLLQLHEELAATKYVSQPFHIL